MGRKEDHARMSQMLRDSGVPFVELNEETDDDKCSKCGSGLKEWNGDKGEFTERCFVCGHEEEVKSSSARSNGMPDEGLNPSSGH